jgi:lysophospholipase L1-like esterase
MPAEIVGCGLCGLTAVEMARGLDAQQLQDNFGRAGLGLRRLLADEGPFDLVLIMAGTNDLGVPQSPATEVLACLKRMHRACWAVGTPSLALSIPESLVTGNPTQYPEAAQKWQAINKGLAAWGRVAQDKNPCNRPFFVNVAELVAFDMAARRQGLWDSDNLHFTAAGSGEFGTHLAPMIASHLSPEGTYCNTDVLEKDITCTIFSNFFEKFMV